MNELREKVILFGPTELNYANDLVNKYSDKISYCVDNDVNKQGKLFKGLIIKPVNSILQEEPSTYTVIIAASYRFNEIASQLISMGLEMDSDFVLGYDMLSPNELMYFWQNENNRVGDTIPHAELTSLHLEYSGYCNLKCIYCPFHGEYGTYKEHSGFMTQETLEVIIQKFKDIKTITSLNLCGHGELFLHKSWYEFTNKIINNLNINELTIYTNGMLLNDDNINKLSNLKQEVNCLSLIISIDGSTPEECESFRVNSNYNLIKQNIYKAHSLLGKSVSIANAQLLSHEYILSRNCKIVRNICAPSFLLKDFSGINIFSRPIYNRNPFYKLNLLNHKCENILIYNIKHYNFCPLLFSELYINNSGEIHKCSCNAVEGNLKIGNIYKNNPLDVFNGHFFECARNKSLNHTDPEMCTKCTSNLNGNYYIPIN